MNTKQHRKGRWDLDRVKNTIVNGGLFLGSLLGLVVLSINLRYFSESSFKTGYYLDFFILLLLGLCYLFRKRLHLSYRITGLVTAILVFSLTDIYRDGVFSDNSVLLILVPFFLQLILPVWKTILAYLVSTSGYFYFAVRYSNGSLTPMRAYDHYAFDLNIWVTYFIILSILAAVVVIVVNAFNGAYREQASDLQDQNAELEEYREKLEQKVREKTSRLEQSNEELNSTLLHLRDTQSQLIQSEKMASLGILTAGVAHEINNPLNFINGGLEGISMHLEKTGDLDKYENLRFYLNSIREGLEKSSKIVQSLNQYSRQTENLDESCDIHQVLDSNLDMLNEQLENRVQVDKRYGEGKMILTGNVGKMHQAFLNILLNASQAIEGEGRITITTGRNREALLVEISDTGTGIKEEDLPWVTDPFFTTRDPGKGTGLGLSITSSIVHEHRGNLSITSTPGEGTTVKVSLPALPDSDS